MRTIERVVFATITNGSALCLNIVLNAVIICGIFRSSGDSRWGFICDVLVMWGFAVPLGFFSAFILKLPPMWVYFLLCLDEFVKMPWVYRHYKSYKWNEKVTAPTKESYFF